MMDGLLSQNGSKSAAKSMPAKGSGKPANDEQSAYTQFVSNGMLMMYSEQVMPKLLQMVQANPESPVEGLGNATAMVLMRLEDSASKSGQSFSEEVKAAAAKEISEQIADLAGPKGADIHEFTQEEIEGAYLSASAVYGNARQGGQEGQQAQPEQQMAAPAPQPGGLMNQGAAY